MLSINYIVHTLGGLKLWFNSFIIVSSRSLFSYSHDFSSFSNCAHHLLRRLCSGLFNSHHVFPRIFPAAYMVLSYVFSKRLRTASGREFILVRSCEVSFCALSMLCNARLQARKHRQLNCRLLTVRTPITASLSSANARHTRIGLYIQFKLPTQHLRLSSD